MSDSSTSALCCAKPVLLLLEHDFEDPKHAVRHFFCGHSWLLEATLPGIDRVRNRLEVRRIGFPRPRRDVIGLVGESDRSLPTLVTCSARCTGSAIAANHPSEGMAELRR
ncbi:DUF3088 family protein [Xanthomonas arboricola]|uniref:Transposase n=1 Tax=Xanthomonas arboricola TaxID=56448 RepID=A0AAU9I6Y4_9XANT|nr:DUF3088 family protein [Xanthomonas arboricola]CAE6850088.1 hypothetical protein XA1314C_40550 [Xanthomonas arboricola]CAE6850108.1 hypothetical protein XA1314C_40550 [Xanthomonas arboricola]